MKEALEHDPLSERPIKGIQENANYIPMKSHLELYTWSKKGAATARVKKKKKQCLADNKNKERDGLRHLVDKYFDNSGFVKMWQTQYHLMTPCKKNF